MTYQPPSPWSGPELTKRQFLIGSGSVAVGALAARLARAQDGSQDRANWDLIVVGAGTAGIPAAIFAARRGARVLLIEASAQLGGTLHLSTGQMSAAGTKVQKAKGIVDTPQEHFDDVWRISKGTVNPELVRLAVFNAAGAYDWLMDAGFEMIPSHPVKGQAHEPYSKDRYYWGVEQGISILKVLEREIAPEIAAGRVRFLSRTEAKELILGDGGAVVGVITEGEDGRSARHMAKAVLLASGGYAANPEMFERMTGVKHYARMSYPYCQGAGVTMGLAAGGFVRGKENYLCNFGAIMADDEPQSVSVGRFNTYPERRPPWEIYVNAQGQRFVREDEPSVDKREHALLRQTDFRFWIVFDDENFKAAPTPVDGWERSAYEDAFGTRPLFYRAGTLAELAAKAGIDGANLAASVAAYNAGQGSGRDALGRTHMPRPVVKPPFYAIRHQGYSITSTAGLAVDTDLRVIRGDGSVVAGLYAAGELLGTGQLMGRAFCGGMNVMPALTFGQMLGARMIPLTT
ncbi:MAG: FAD-binding protein [Rhodospirillaceae bacterium]|nr:FAD-binding protein [Rhodospirillaceae bacterium]